MERNNDQIEIQIGDKIWDKLNWTTWNKIMLGVDKKISKQFQKQIEIHIDEQIMRKIVSEIQSNIKYGRN